MILLIIIITLSILDLFLTWGYINKYKKWQPNKDYDLMERNPLLIWLWKTFGFKAGMTIGSIIVLTLNILVVIYTHWIVSVFLIIILLIVLDTNLKNIEILNKLIKKYPKGHLPEKTFGKVQGNNQKGGIKNVKIKK